MSVKSEELLERIATALEGIDKSLSDMQQSAEVLEVLADPVSNGPHGAFLCVTGNLTTYEG